MTKKEPTEVLNTKLKEATLSFINQALQEISEKVASLRELVNDTLKAIQRKEETEDSKGHLLLIGTHKGTRETFHTIGFDKIQSVKGYLWIPKDQEIPEFIHIAVMKPVGGNKK